MVLGSTSTRIRLFGAVCAVVWCGCCPEPVAGGGADAALSSGEAGPVGARLSTVQQVVFDRHCVSDCHETGNAAAGLRLRRGQSHGQLVNRASQQIRSRLRVAPGVPGSSYLLQKMTGQGGIVGDRMPRLAPPRPASELEAVRLWIVRGAAND